MFAAPRRVRFRELEPGIPLEGVRDALREIRSLVEASGRTVSFSVEKRASAAGDLWLSMAWGRSTGWIPVHRYAREDPGECSRAVEVALRGYGGRPHWGRVHHQGVDSLAGSYPRFADSLALRDRFDPDRVVANDHLERVLGR